MTFLIRIINYLISLVKSSSGNISDGTYTFDELYNERVQLLIIVSRLMIRHDTRAIAWRTKSFYNGQTKKGFFIYGLSRGDRSRQIVILIPESLWDKVFFAEEIVRAPKFDTLTPEETLHRLKNLI